MSMKRTSIALAGAITLSLGGYLAMAPSAACCGDGAVASQGAISAGATVTAAVSAAGSSIVALLTQIDLTISNGFGKMYSEMSKQTASARVMEQGRIEADYSNYVNEKRADIQQDFALSPRACYEKQASNAVAEASNSVAGAVQTLNRDFSALTLHTPNTAAAVNKIYADHASKYCSAQDAKLGRCSSAASADLQNADVRVDNLLRPDRNVLTPEQYDAAVKFMRNTVNPIPTQQIPAGWEKTEQGKAFVAAQLVEQARSSVASNSFSQMIAMRQVQPGLGSSAGLNTADVSMLQLVKSQVDGRFLSKDWYAMIAGLGDANLLREQNKMQALDLWLALQQYQQGERIEALLATDLAASVKRDSDERLAKARIAAARSKGN